MAGDPQLVQGQLAAAWRDRSDAWRDRMMRGGTEVMRGADGVMRGGTGLMRGADGVMRPTPATLRVAAPGNVLVIKKSDDSKIDPVHGDSTPKSIAYASHVRVTPPAYPEKTAKLSRGCRSISSLTNKF
jgi:hypothetical protein